VRLVVDGPDGIVMHSELEFGGAVVMVTGAGKDHRRDGQPWRGLLAAPTQVGGKLTQNLGLYIDDVDAHCARAQKAGADVLAMPTTVDYGEGYWSDRTYAALDCGGHLWWFLQRL
jgi:uncharacterized glyoxalase superfamily protein PhnB